MFGAEQQRCRISAIAHAELLNHVAVPVPSASTAAAAGARSAGQRGLARPRRKRRRAEHARPHIWNLSASPLTCRSPSCGVNMVSGKPGSFLFSGSPDLCQALLSGNREPVAGSRSLATYRRARPASNRTKVSRPPPDLFSSVPQCHINMPGRFPRTEKSKIDRGSEYLT